MEQAQFGVLEMDWFIASLQPMRWIKVPGGCSRARRGRTFGGAVIPLPTNRRSLQWHRLYKTTLSITRRMSFFGQPAKCGVAHTSFLFAPLKSGIATSIWIRPIALSVAAILLTSLVVAEAYSHAKALNIRDPEDLALAYLLPTIFQYFLAARSRSQLPSEADSPLLILSIRRK